LVVSTGPLLTSSPDAVTFNHQLGGITPGAQTVTVQSTSGNLPFTVSPTTSGTSGDWLSVTQVGTSTPGNITISVNQTRLLQLAAGQYQGGIVVTAPGAQNSPYTVPVTLNVSGSAFLVVDPTSLDFGSVQPGGAAPATRSFVVRSTDGTNQTFQVTTETPWISLPSAGIPQQTGLTGLPVNVNISPSQLPATGGRIEGAITVTPIVNSGTMAPTQRVPVFVTVAAANTLTANPTSLTFTQVGTTPPGNQTVQVSTTLMGASYSARADQPWISVTPASGPLNATVTVTVSGAGLMLGQQTGNVIVTVPGATDLRIPVTLNLQGTATLTAAPTSLNFASTTGAAQPPANQTIALTSSGVPIDFKTATTTATGGNWLTATPASGTTGATGAPASNVTVSVNPAGLQAGTYNGTVTITGTNAANPLQAINVVLTVSNAAIPLITSVQNAASNAPTNLSPGLIVAVKGTNLGPATGQSPTAADPGTVLGTELGQVRVLFDNIPAPLLFVRQDQVNTVVPYEIFGRSTSRVVVEYRGVRSEPLEMRVSDSAPGIFSADSTGRGQGSILNQDSSVNGVNTPAARGSFIVLYATGEGQTNPQGVTGRITLPQASDFRHPLGAVSVFFGGVPVPASDITYVGSAPGFVAGALQINVRVPGTPAAPGTPASITDVQVQVGSSQSQSGLTVAVR